MQITDVKTTVLSMPHLTGIQDATIRHLEQGRTQCFVHIVTDEGLEGLGTGGGARAAREIIEGSLKPILVGQDPLNIEQLWDDMFWRIRGVGRKGLAAIAHATAISIATGEHEYTKYGFKDLIARGGADIVQPDVGRVGGITEWMKVAHLAHAFNLPVAPHAYQLIHLHLACATPNLRIVEYLGMVEEADRITYTEFSEPVNGVWSPNPDKPGLGLELDPEAVKQYAV